MKLLPGHFLTWHDGEISSHRYWQANPTDHGSLPSVEDATAQLDQLLTRSVKEHLVADVPVGVWLSGGIDSSTVLHYASQHASRQLKTFSITFNGREFDEARYVAKMASRYGTDHHELDLGPATVTPESITELAYYSDEPNADAGAVPVWHLSRMSAKDVTVALSGEGADELFGGYITYLADTYARRARIVAPRSTAALPPLGGPAAAPPTRRSASTTNCSASCMERCLTNAARTSSGMEPSRATSVVNSCSRTTTPTC